MTDNRASEVERVLDMPLGPERDTAIESLSDREQTLIAEQERLDTLIRDSLLAAPPLASDPVAALLGLIPDPSMQLDSAQFAKLCKKRGAKPNALATALRNRGWQIDASDVFRWQTGSTSDAHPALIKAVAELLDASTSDLIASSASVLDRVTATVMETRQFENLAKRLATAQHTTVEMARSALGSRMLAVVHRGDEVEPNQMLQSLETLVAALEAD